MNAQNKHIALTAKQSYQERDIGLHKCMMKQYHYLRCLVAVMKRIKDLRANLQLCNALTASVLREVLGIIAQVCDTKKIVYNV